MQCITKWLFDWCKNSPSKTKNAVVIDFIDVDEIKLVTKLKTG